MSSQDDDAESSSCDRDDSFSTNNSSPVKNEALSPTISSMTYETATMAQDDPFYIFRGDLVKKLLLVEGQLERYQEVIRTTVS